MFKGTELLFITKSDVLDAISTSLVKSNVVLVGTVVAVTPIGNTSVLLYETANHLYEPFCKSIVPTAPAVNGTDLTKE